VRDVHGVKVPVGILLLAVAACAHAPAAPARPPRQATASLARPGAAGDRLVAETMAGETVEIGGPGPVRLVELWATWCVPCGPAAERARSVLARHPQVVAYAVALDSDRGAVLRHLASVPGVGTPLLYPGGASAAARRGLDRVPMFVALDARGKVAGTVTGLSSNLGPALERLLSQAEGRAGRRD